jgi:hypothetical protein
LISKCPKRGDFIPEFKWCASCGAELHRGAKVVRVQYGDIYYCKHVGVKRKAATDDYFCEECVKNGKVAIRGAI